MEEYSVVDRRKHSFVVLDKSIPLAYAPYIGTNATCLYLLYASLADQGNVSVDQDDVKEFLGFDDETLESCNQTLEEYGLLKMENREHNGKILSYCYVLQPPPLPQTLYTELRKKPLAKYAENILDFVPAEKPTKKRRTRRSLITPTKLINKLYKSIGVGKVDVFERESGKKHVNDLLEAGYSLEDIDFAIEWGLESAIDEIEDFSSIKNIIGRAIAAREEHLAKRSQKVEEEVKQNEDELLERSMIDSYRKMMSNSEQKKLRERVMNEIRNDDKIKEEFVTDQLIVIKENEIIRKEYLKRGI